MGKILEALAADCISAEPAIYHGSKEYQETKARFHELEDQLLEKLGDEEKKLFDQYAYVQNEESNLYGTNRFIRGFRLGALLMMEVMAESDTLILHQEK